MIGAKLALPDNLNQAIFKEIEKIKKVIEQNRDSLIDDTVEFRHQFIA
jgi:hypothetical protein